MVKSDIIQKLCNLYPNLYKNDLTRAVDVFFDEISNSLIKGNNCEIRSFGTFKAKTRKAREARNPKSGQKIFIKKKIIPAFKMSRLLKIEINKGLQEEEKL